MKFSTLAQYFEKLEAETKRNELVAILAELFRGSTPKEIDKICYLTQGRTAPFFEPLEIGMADKMVAEAIGRAFGPTSPRLRGASNPKEEVLKEYEKKGDLGLAAQVFAHRLQTTDEGKRKKTVDRSQLSVSEVFSKLLEIAKTQGVGTVEKKVSSLSSLLSQLDPVSVKHVVRIPLGRGRLGIGDPTILDALSFAKKGDKSLRPELEQAYNYTSDLGYVAKTFWQGGIEAVKKVRVQVGKPIRPALAERLPSAEEVVKRMGREFACQPKFDGFRVAVHLDRSQKDGKVKLFSRNLENMTHMFPDLIEGVLQEVKAQKAIIDGETLAYNPESEEFYPFQETTKRRRKYGVEEYALKLPLKLFTFDLLYLDGKDITPQPYRQRRKLLEKIIVKDGQKILLAQEKILHTPGEIISYFEEEIAHGLEGLVIKKLEAPYQAGGRGFHWVKFKRMAGGELKDTVDCVILGYIYGRGKRTAFGAGALLVGVYDDKKDEFVSISKIGTGLSDEEWRKIKEMGAKVQIDHKPARVNSLIVPSVWLKPEIVIEVFADEITRSPVHTAGKVDGEPGFALRFPRLISFRGRDKRPEDATTVSEIIKMYNDQFKKKH
jgi:DNA ligase-1